jgi:hypothetical protein
LQNSRVSAIIRRTVPTSGKADAVARKALAIGPSVLRVIEDAPIDLVLAVLSLRESESEPDLGPQICSVERTDGGDREGLLRALESLHQEDLQHLEQRCRRIRTLAEGKGASSLETVVGQRLSSEQYDGYVDQLDPLCRSIWTYITFIKVFEDAESFYLARQFRDYEKLYDALEIDLEEDAPLDAAAIDKPALAAKIQDILGLKQQVTIRGLDLPPAGTHPASIMLIVRHGGPLSSVYHHNDDGRRQPIYFRHPNEAVLIYTPAMRQIEICADSPVVRQKVAGCFAEVALGYDISRKPLTLKRYDLSRFRSSLTLHLPEVEGFALLAAKVLEIELRLGRWERKLSLKVTFDDDIAGVADQYLGRNSIVLRAESFSRVAIGVRYHRTGDERERSLNITISGGKSCNLQSNKDPEQRGLGYRLLDAWGIMSAFKPIETIELQAMFPQLLMLFDRAEDEVTGFLLREAGLDPKRLIESGLLERRGRQEIVLLNEDGTTEGEALIRSSSTPGMVRATGPFGEDLGERPAADLEIYQLNVQWLHETLIGLIKPLLTDRAIQILDADLTLLGAATIDDAKVPLYFARRLHDAKTISKLDLLLRGRSNSGFGIVLATGSDLLPCLGPNVVIPLLSHLSDGEDEPVLSRGGIQFAFRSGRSLARGGSVPTLHRYANQSAMLYVPGSAPLPLLGAVRINIFERLVEAYIAGSPDVKANTLMEGAKSQSPQHAFRSKTWKSIIDVYITKGSRNGYWRLVVPDAPTVAV